MKAQQKETKWVCIELACSRKPKAFEEAHHWNIQAKFYNEKFPLVYESDSIGDSLYEEHGAILKHKCGKRIVTLPLFFFFYFLFFLFLDGLLWPPFLFRLLWPLLFFNFFMGQWSVMMIITLLFPYKSILQLDTRTKI